jgi:HAD superfamily hydrolase (TIGR01509 family)
MLTHRPKAVIFDLDGLILDSEIIYRKAWKQAAEELGYCMNDEQYLRFLGRRDVDCEMMLVETYGSSFPLTDFLIRSDSLSREHLKKHGITTKPGVHELLNFLDARSVRRAIATSTERGNVLSALGSLAERFNVIVTGEDVTVGKPAPDILLLCARLLKVEPQDCVVLEDSEVGVQAAHAAAMPVVIVPDLHQPSAQSATNAVAVCDSLHAVTDSLRKLWTPIVQ